MRELSLEENLRGKPARARQWIFRRPLDVRPRVLLTEKEIGKPIIEQIEAMEDDVLLSELAA